MKPILLKVALMYLFLLMNCTQFVSEKDIQGAWIPEKMAWEAPQPELEIPGNTASAKTLYFSSDSAFAMFEWLLYKTDLDSLNAGLGDGFFVYKGTWQQLSQEQLLIKYRIMYRSVLTVKGEVLPGSFQIDTLAIKDLGGTIFNLKMKGNVFMKSPMLTGETQRFMMGCADKNSLPPY